MVGVGVGVAVQIGVTVGTMVRTLFFFLKDDYIPKVR
jgi:hypothetical protein